jgi:required for meiotic nuclear division protein 1
MSPQAVDHASVSQALAAHSFHAVAFVENLSLKELASSYPEARRTLREIWFRTDSGGEIFIFPFGAVAFMDVATSERAPEIARLRAALPHLSSAAVEGEDLAVREDPTVKPGVKNGLLWLDRMTPERANIIALTMAQSAAMEYYERIVEAMFGKTDQLVERLEAKGTVPFSTRPLHRFIGAAIGTRNEVLSVLHLLDKPDEAWDDTGMDLIYDELRAEFDLVDRYQALELKLRSVQEALELVLDVARDRRLVLLEAAVVLLIVLEIGLTFIRTHP